MARKPADQVAAARWPQGRQVIWTAIRALGRDDQTFTRADVWTACKREILRSTIKTYLDGLEKGGFLESEQPGTRLAKPYRLVDDPGAEAPRVNRKGKTVTQGLGTDAMWRTIKLLSTFTYRELALTASTAQVTIRDETAKDYCKHLAKAKLLRVVVPATPKALAQYAFAKSRDPGPKAPQIQRVKRVFDPNSNTVLWPVPRGES